MSTATLPQLTTVNPSTTLLNLVSATKFLSSGAPIAEAIAKRIALHLQEGSTSIA